MLITALYILLAAALVVYAIWTPGRARRIRDGWTSPKYSGRRSEFVARTRSEYTRAGWLGVVVGGGNLVLAVLSFLEGQSGVYRMVFIAAAFIGFAAVAFECRRILDGPAQPRPAAAGPDPAGGGVIPPDAG
jgi:hypothetical protein